jgi:hypothetical protein
MSSILYYSNYCEHSKKLIQQLSKSSIKNNIHFICIDNRVKETDGKIYIVLQNGKKIILPEIINCVPSLMKLSDYSVYFGDDIQNILMIQENMINMEATKGNLEPTAYSQTSNQIVYQNNYEPTAFSFENGTSGIVSDNFSFIDTDPDDLKAEGSGGTRLMHHYADLNENDVITETQEEPSLNKNKLPEGLTLEQLQKQRETDMINITR